MNQILEFGTDKRNKSPKNSSSSDKAVRVFAIILMIFALALIGSGVYSLLKNKDTSSESGGVSNVSTYNPVINAIMDEANSKVIITVESETPIDRVSYNWNSNSDSTLDGESALEFEKSIDLPSGTNTLNIKVKDINGDSAMQSFDFTSESGEDIINPNIILEVTEENKLSITAVDETEMSFLTYRWNDDEETTVNVEEDAEDKTTIEVTIEIPKGTNTITVVAVDASSKHNSRTATKSFTGNLLPEITQSGHLESDGRTLLVNCSHENGIKEITYTLNDKTETITYPGEDGTYPTDLTIKVKFEDGHNTIQIKVVSVDDTEKVFNAVCDIGDNTEDNGDETEEDSESNETEETN